MGDGATTVKLCCPHAIQVVGGLGFPRYQADADNLHAIESDKEFTERIKRDFGLDLNL